MRIPRTLKERPFCSSPLMTDTTIFFSSEKVFIQACCEMTQTLEKFTDHYEFCVHTFAIKTCATPCWEVIWTTQLLLPKIVVRFHAVGLCAILAPTPMLQLQSALLGDISLLIPSTPVQATTWCTLSIVVPATRFTSEKQEHAWETAGLREHLRSTRQTTVIFPVGRHFASPYWYGGVRNPLWLLIYSK